MTSENPGQNLEKREGLEDNARKFTTEPIDVDFINGLNPTSFTLIVDWLETDEASEQKLARKTFGDGTLQMLLITKETQNGSRKTVKELLDAERYDELLKDSVLHLEKKRYEFAYEQAGTVFEVKYDVFADDKLHMLEVDAASNDARMAFAANDFPSALTEVTGNPGYYGYRVCNML